MVVQVHVHHVLEETIQFYPYVQVKIQSPVKVQDPYQQEGTQPSWEQSHNHSLPSE